jgi:hypothetical protein
MTASKVYILVREKMIQEHLGLAICSVAHAGAICILEGQRQNSQEFKDWLDNSFKKVVCKVSEEEFEQARAYGPSIYVSESTLGGEIISCVFSPREEWPEFFKNLRLWQEAKPKVDILQSAFVKHMLKYWPNSIVSQLAKTVQNLS